MDNEVYRVAAHTIHNRSGVTVVQEMPPGASIESLVKARSDMAAKYGWARIEKICPRGWEEAKILHLVGNA